MPLAELPESERACLNCGAPMCNVVRSKACPKWRESRASHIDRAHRYIADLERALQASRMLDRQRERGETRAALQKIEALSGGLGSSELMAIWRIAHYALNGVAQ